MGAACGCDSPPEKIFEDAESVKVPAQTLTRVGPRPKAKAAQARVVYSAGAEGWSLSGPSSLAAGAVTGCTGAASQVLWLTGVGTGGDNKDSAALAEEARQRASCVRISCTGAVIQGIFGGDKATPAPVPRLMPKPKPTSGKRNGVPQTSPPPPHVIKAGRPDFTGDYLCVEVLGDVDALLTALDVGWARRTAAQAIGYGARIASRHVKQNFDDMTVQVGGTPKDYAQSFYIGGGKQVSKGPDGDILATPIWEEQYVLKVDQTEVDGSLPNTWRQYFDGEDLMLMLAVPSGVAAYWKFQRMKQAA